MRLDGPKLPVEMHHKLISDYFDACQQLDSIKPVIRELGLQKRS